MLRLAPAVRGHTRVRRVPSLILGSETINAIIGFERIRSEYLAQTRTTSLSQGHCQT